jgi:MlaD protein
MLLVAMTVSALPAAETWPVRTAQLAQLPPAARPAAPAIVNGVPFLIRFAGTVRGLEPGVAVEIQGIRIGDVRSVGLEYAPDSNSFVVPVVIELQPNLFPAFGPQPGTAEELMRRRTRWCGVGCARSFPTRSCWAAMRS